MTKVRYKVTKEQLEQVVENFVMESAMNTGKAKVKNMIPKQSPDAKKYVKNKISGNMVDQSENMPSVTPMKKKLSQAPEAKKYMAKGKTKHSTKTKVHEGFGEFSTGALSLPEFLAALGFGASVAIAAWKLTFGSDAEPPKDIKKMEEELDGKSKGEKRSFFKNLFNK